MGQLAPMPPIEIDPGELAPFGQEWISKGNRFNKAQSMRFGSVFDKPVARALATMLGGIPVVEAPKKVLIPPQRDCVEVGEVTIIRAIRSQQYDVAYRPDGVRFAFDSKTLNTAKSIGKNFQNMVNDLGTEAANLHSRFPHAVVGFIVALPKPCLAPTRQATMIETLTRLAERADEGDPAHEAEAISLVVWDPDDGAIDSNIPDQASPLRIEKFSRYVQKAYFGRYSTLPPHDR